MRAIRALYVGFMLAAWFVVAMPGDARPNSQNQSPPTQQKQKEKQPEPDRPIPSGPQLMGPRYRLPPMDPSAAIQDEPPPLRERPGPPEMTIQEGAIVIRNQELEDVIEALARKAGLNALFDATFRSRKVSFELRGVNPRQALEAIVEANSLFIVPVNERTLLIAVDNSVNHIRLEEVFVRTFQLKHADPQIVQTNIAALFGQRVMIVPNAELRAVTVRTTMPALDMVKDLIEKLDQPPPRENQENLEVTIYLLAASEQMGEPLSTSLRRVFERSGGSGGFPVEKYRLLDTLFVRTRTGSRGSAIQAVAPAGHPGPRKSFYSFVIDRPELMSEGARRTISFDMSVGANVPIGAAPPEKEGQPEKVMYENTRLSTKIAVSEGESVVVGQAPLLQSDIPILVVLSAKAIH